MEKEQKKLLENSSVTKYLYVTSLRQSSNSISENKKLFIEKLKALQKKFNFD